MTFDPLMQTVNVDGVVYDMAEIHAALMAVGGVHATLPKVELRISERLPGRIGAAVVEAT